MDADPFFWHAGGEVFGPYYRSAAVHNLVQNGTCEEAILEQTTCPSESFTVDYSSMGWGSARVSVRGCTTLSYTLPITNPNGEALRIATTCRSWHNDSITSGYEDVMEVYIGSNDDSCTKGVTEPKYTPKLTSADWIEPIPGRRYMCYDGSYYDGQSFLPYYVMFLSLGNEPCSGPKPTQSPTTTTTPTATPTTTPTSGQTRLSNYFPLVTVVPTVAFFATIW